MIQSPRAEQSLEMLCVMGEDHVSVADVSVINLMTWRYMENSASVTMSPVLDSMVWMHAQYKDLI